jgi:hypothetical protein
MIQAKLVYPQASCGHADYYESQRVKTLSMSDLCKVRDQS